MAKGETERLLDLGTNVGVDDQLPPRLFATDRYPEGRLNIYSRPDILTVARKVLEGSTQWDKLINSQFGVLFTLPVGKCSQYGKLLHALLCRQLVTKRKYEMWTVFGGHPMRFSLVEFGCVTGLSCAEFPTGYDPDEPCNPVEGEKYFWHELIGNNMRSTLGDVSTLLEENPKMPLDRKLCLVLILIVDGILIAKTQTHKPTFKYVEMLRNIDEFLVFPWGRESFLPTIASLIPTPEKSPKLQEVAVEDFRQQLQQQSKCLLGFPLALQLLALQNISGLISKSWAATEKRNFIEWRKVGLKKHSMALKAVHAVERDESLTVQPLLYASHLTEDGWGEWDDEITDRKVAYMLKQIRKGHVFHKCEWAGGCDSLPSITDVSTNDDCVHKKHVILRKRKTSKQNEPSTSSTVTRSKRSHVQTPTELQMLKESMESQMVELRQNLTVQIQEISQEMKKLRRKYQSLKFKRAGVVGSRTCKFSAGRRVRKSRLRNSSPSIETPDDNIVDSPSLDKSGDGNAANNNSDEVLHDPTFSGDILFPGKPHDWNKYVQDIVNESSDDEGQGMFDANTIEDDQIHSTTSEGLVNEDASLSGENLDQSKTYDVNGGSKVANAFTIVETNVSDRMDPTVEGVVGNGSTSVEPPIENPPLSHSLGQPIFDTPTKNIPFEADNDYAPIYDTVTKPRTNEGTSSASLSTILSKPLTQELPGQPAYLNAVDELFGKPDPHETAGEHINQVENPQSDEVQSSVQTAGEHVNQIEIPLSDAVHSSVQTAREHVNQIENPQSGAVQSSGQTAGEHVNQIENPHSDAVQYFLQIPLEEVNKTDNPHNLAPTPPLEDAGELVNQIGNPQSDAQQYSVQTAGEHVNQIENPQSDAQQYSVQLPMPHVTDTENYQSLTTTYSDEHAKQHVDDFDQQPGQDLGLQYLLADGNLIDGLADANDDQVELFELSDSSPPSEKQRRVPTEAESVLVGRFLSQTKQDSYDILPSVDASEFSFFKDTLTSAPETKHITSCGDLLDHQFILDLASPQQWVSTLHMEVLVKLIQRRHKSTLSHQRATIATPFMCNYIIGKSRAFKAAKIKSLVHWPEQLVRIITAPGSTWVDDIDTIYVPMIWEDTHWVGLVITLGIWTIDVFDPNTNLYPIKDVRKFMDPLAEMLPHVINAHCIMPLSQSHGLKPFRWSRVEGIYRNVRGGDCGPVAMKFLEIELSDSGSEKLAEINDELVDDFRKQYAMDVYKEFIAPVYDQGYM